MNTPKFLAVILASSLALQTPVWAYLEPRRSEKDLRSEGRSSKELQDAFLRKTRLLQQKQELQRLREDVSREAVAKAGGGKPGGGGQPPVTTYPNDPYYNSSGSWGQSYQDLWGVKKIGLDASVWNLYKGEGITIAVVDTGVLANHEDLNGRLWTNDIELGGVAGVDDDGDGYVDDFRGWDFVDNDNTPTDLNGHGSHVAGIAAATGNNGKGIIGVAPLAKIMPVRVLGQNGSGSISAVAKGIEYAARAGAHIINLSLGAANLDLGSLSLLQAAVDLARNLGRIVIAAAGNSASNVDQFSPANLNGVIAVGATDVNDARASFSNFGSKLFLTAPGVDILSLGSTSVNIGTRLNKNYYRASGTSMAAPFVSGAVALLLDKYPDASLEFIRERLSAGAVDLGAAGWDPYYGYGRLNIAASLGLTSTSSSTPSSTGTFSGSSFPGAASLSSTFTSEAGAAEQHLFLKRRFEEELLLISPAL